LAGSSKLVEEKRIANTFLQVMLAIGERAAVGACPVLFQLLLAAALAYASKTNQYTPQPHHLHLAQTHCRADETSAIQALDLSFIQGSALDRARAVSLEYIWAARAWLA